MQSNTFFSNLANKNVKKAHLIAHIISKCALKKSFSAFLLLN